MKFLKMLSEQEAVIYVAAIEQQKLQDIFEVYARHIDLCDPFFPPNAIYTLGVINTSKYDITSIFETLEYKLLVQTVENIQNREKLEECKEKNNQLERNLKECISLSEHMSNLYRELRHLVKIRFGV